LLASFRISRTHFQAGEALVLLMFALGAIGNSVEAKDFEQWEAGDLKDAVALMKRAPEDVLEKWPVSKRVNSSKADDNDATLIEKVELGQSNHAETAVGQ
jgi:hypothetical protein